MHARRESFAQRLRILKIRYNTSGTHAAHDMGGEVSFSKHTGTCHLQKEYTTQNSLTYACTTSCTGDPASILETYTSSNKTRQLRRCFSQEPKTIPGFEFQIMFWFQFLFGNSDLSVSNLGLFILRSKMGSEALSSQKHGITRNH